MHRALSLLLVPLLAALASGTVLATVNVNTAQQSELQRVKGIDKRKAKAIIDFRNEHGRIDSLDALAQVPGFTPALVEKVQPEIAFTGDPYVPKPRAPSRSGKGRK